MNIPGINKVYYIRKSQVAIPNISDASEAFLLTPHLTGTLTELDFEKGTCTLEQEPAENIAGEFFKSLATLTVSGIDPANHKIVSALAAEPHVFVFGDNEGQYFLLGTQVFRAKFKYRMVNADPPESKKNYAVTITLDSLHGLAFCTI